MSFDEIIDHCGTDATKWDLMESSQAYRQKMGSLCGSTEHPIALGGQT